MKSCLSNFDVGVEKGLALYNGLHCLLFSVTTERKRKSTQSRLLPCSYYHIYEFDNTFVVSSPWKVLEMNIALEGASRQFYIEASGSCSIFNFFQQHSPLILMIRTLALI